MRGSRDSRDPALDSNGSFVAVPVGAALAVALLLTLLAAMPAGSAPDDEPREQEPPAAFSLAGDLERGRTIFLKSCASCHGDDGSGEGRIALDPPARDLRDAERMGQRTDWDVFVVIRDGGKALDLSPKMIPWRSVLDEQEIHDVGVFVRSLASPAASDTPGDSG